MSEQITDDYLSNLEELWSATTGGKWYSDKGTIRTDVGGDPVGRTGYVTWRGVRGYEPQEVTNNAQWIVAAHESFLQLIAEVRRLRGEVERRSHRIDDLARMLRQCAVALVPMGGDDEDMTAINAAMDTALEDIPGLVNDHVSDLECDLHAERSEVERLRADNRGWETRYDMLLTQVGGEEFDREIAAKKLAREM